MFMNLIDRARNILLSPNTEWQVIKGESATPQSLLTSYVLPLALIPTAVSLLVGITYTTFNHGLILAAIAFIGVIISFYISTYITDSLAPSFSSEKNINRSAQLVAYSLTAAAVASILLFIPGLGVLVMLVGSIYSLYLFYLGIGPMKNTPDEKKVIYVIVIILVQFIVNYILNNIIYGAIIRSMYTPF